MFISNDLTIISNPVPASISSVLDKAKNEIKYMSHPCGSYNNDTLKILKELGIELGFKQIMTIETEKGMKKLNNSFLTIVFSGKIKFGSSGE